ncbi:hypothetical protein C9374_006823 [Naegleria lovaniensis]|uniref:Methyltransferase domain-containing protein n=1 Tax=Naegleria lovaniensis TaxID=51637 RepID=A0AA88KRJ3_NAELO|nr:uncharacterized protein C9374_006823 [Naegleria lovaniensis]KAG2393292.1 hypothetical protein C9374_006823 [Naegleria lovaniensis]
MMTQQPTENTSVFLFDGGKLKGTILSLSSSEQALNASLSDETSLPSSSSSSAPPHHDSKQNQIFQPHDGVFCQGGYVWTLQSKKLYAIGRVLELVTDISSPFVGRYKIEYCKDQSRYHCKGERMVPIFRAATRKFGKIHSISSHDDNNVDIIVCNETSDFRLLAKTQVFNNYDFIQRDVLATTGNSSSTTLNNNSHNVGGESQPSQMGDFVLEIGSALGETSKLLHEKCAKLLCLDISKAYVEETKKKFPHIEFWCADIMSPDDQKRVIRTWRKFMYEHPSSELKVFIDINGNRMLEAVRNVVEFVKTSLKPSLIVVKSSEYYSHLRNSCCEDQ